MNTQLLDLAIAFVVTAAAMLAGLLVARADRRAYWRWPVYATMVLMLGVVSWSFLRKHLLPAEWAITRPGLLYYGALALYAFLGLGLGILLGRLTRRKTPSDDPFRERT